MESAALRYLRYCHRQPGDCGKNIRPAIGQKRWWRLYEREETEGTGKKYVIRLSDSTLVEVNRKIYLEWYRSERRERYQKERDRKYGLCSIDKFHEKGYFPEQSIFASDTTQETVLRNEYQSRLQNALKNLAEQKIRKMMEEM